MLLELAVFTGWAVVSGLCFTKMVRWEARLWKYPTHVFGEWSLIQPEISEYYFINRTLFCTVLNKSLHLKRRKNLEKRGRGGPCMKAGMNQNHFNILVNSLLIEIVLRRILSGFITRKGCCGITELLRLAGSPGGHLVQSPAQVGSPRPGCLGLCPGRFWISPKVWKRHSCSGQPLPVLSYPHSKTKCFLIFMQFQFVLFTSCPVTECHWKELGSVPFTPSLHVFTYVNKITLEPSLLQAERSCSQPYLVGEMLQPLYYTRAGVSLVSL